MTNTKLIVNNQDLDFLIKEAPQRLVPWWFYDEKEILKNETYPNPKHYLDSFYLLPIREILVDYRYDDFSKYINERFRNILAAVTISGFSVALVVSSRGGKIEIFIGFKNEKNRNLSDESKSIFKSIVKGIMPGRGMSIKENLNISSLSRDFSHGGIITGIPILKQDNERQKFNLSSVIRSLYGRDFLLSIISKPLDKDFKIRQFNELIKIRDELHKLVRQNVSEERGTSTSTSNSETVSNSISKTQGNSVGLTPGIGFPTPFGFIGGGINFGHNRSETKVDSKSEGKTSTDTSSESRSVSIEKQNGYALELEKIANHYIERILIGFQSGYWDTTITFATPDNTTSNILAGVFVGELSKPETKLLPPPRVFFDSLGDRALFIPKDKDSDTVIGNPLSSYITSEELSLISSPPVESVPGYEVYYIPELSLTDKTDNAEIKIGNIIDHGIPIPNNYFYLSKNDLNKHLFVCGITGSGKTTTVKNILKHIAKENIPFLVLESAKRDYRQLLADEVFDKDNLKVFTIGDATVSPIRFNPFYVQEGVHPLVHIDNLKAIFNASFSLYGPMPSILEKCLHNMYIKRGWDLTKGIHPSFLNEKGELNDEIYKSDVHFYYYPTLIDLKNEIEDYINNKLEYKGELRDNIKTAIIVRLESLCVGSKGLMFNTYDFFPIDKLLSMNVIMEMESLSDDDDKAFFVGLMLTLISEYRQKENPAINPGARNRGLRHLLVIEEAHRLLKNIETERKTEMMGNPKGKAVEMFCNMLSEMRSMGQGVAVVEQIPSKIAIDVIKNSNTKIIHRLVSRDDQLLMAGALGLYDNESTYLNRLETGHALCHKEGMARPVECYFPDNVQSCAISDEKVHKLFISSNYKELASLCAYELDNVLGSDGSKLAVQFFNSLVLQPDEISSVVGLYKDKLRKLILVNDQYGRDVEEKDMIDYTKLKIMNLLTKGIYRSKKIMPQNFISVLESMIKNNDKEYRDELYNMLSQIWSPKSAVQQIEDVIFNLLLDNLKAIGEVENKEYIKKILSWYFIQEDDKVIDELSDKFYKNVEGVI